MNPGLGYLEMESHRKSFKLATRVRKMLCNLSTNKHNNPAKLVTLEVDVLWSFIPPSIYLIHDVISYMYKH